MAALFGPAIGARTSRQEDFGHTAPRAMAQHKTIKSFIVSISLILLYHLSDGSPTGPIKATPANLPSGTVGCFAPPTNSLTETHPRSRNTKHAQRSPYVYNTHNIQLTPSNNTIDEHLSQTWSPGHHPRQDQPETTQNKHVNTPYTKIHPTNTTNRPTHLPATAPRKPNTNNGTAQT